jgi:hypothetical protein
VGVIPKLVANKPSHTFVEVTFTGQPASPIRARVSDYHDGLTLSPQGEHVYQKGDGLCSLSLEWDRCPAHVVYEYIIDLILWLLIERLPAIEIGNARVKRQCL